MNIELSIIEQSLIKGLLRDVITKDAGYDRAKVGISLLKRISNTKLVIPKGYCPVCNGFITDCPKKAESDCCCEDD